MHCGAVPSLNAAFKWIIGSGTWLYFVPVFLACQIILNLVLKTRSALQMPIILIVMACSIISIIMGYGGLRVFGSVFLNPLNWIIYTLVGYLIGRWLSGRQIGFSIRFFGISLILLAALFTVYFSLMDGIYLSIITIPFVLFGFVFLLEICFLWKSLFLRNIGTNTYVIYFAHMQFGIGYVTKFTLMTSSFAFLYDFLIFIKPVLAVFLIYGIVKIIILVAKKTGLSKCLWVVGINAD